MANDKLGIMITKHENREHIVGIAKAAKAAGHSVMVFMTDIAVRFTEDPGFLRSLGAVCIDLSICEHSCKELGIESRAEGVTYGSQYNNAGMLHDCSRILVF